MQQLLRLRDWWERGWGGGGKSDEDVYEVIIMDDSLCKLLPDLVILIEIE